MPKYMQQEDGRKVTDSRENAGWGLGEWGRGTLYKCWIRGDGFPMTPSKEKEAEDKKPGQG